MSYIKTWHDKSTFWDFQKHNDSVIITKFGKSLQIYSEGFTSPLWMWNYCDTISKLAQNIETVCTCLTDLKKNARDKWKNVNHEDD